MKHTQTPRHHHFRHRRSTTLPPPQLHPKISGSSDEHRYSPYRSDLKSCVAVDSRFSSGSSPKRPDLHQKQRSSGSSEEDSGRNKRREVNRCSGGCRRKVGLMGFHCRCGEIFCSDHRYSDRHDCVTITKPLEEKRSLVKIRWLERPDSIKSYTLSSDDGSFVVELEKLCYIRFDYLVYYDSKITGKLNCGSITDLDGIQVKKFFFWLSVDEIGVEMNKHVDFFPNFLIILCT